MDKNSNAYVFSFAVGLCVLFSAALAAIANQLGPVIQANEEYDRQRNIMVAAQLAADPDPRPRPTLEAVYKNQVEELVLDDAGKVVADMKPGDVYGMRDKDKRKHYHPLYKIHDEQGKVTAFVIPISGYGLWSTLYGFLALGADANKVVGITFYKHGETPGLGGEVDNPNWKASWRDKTILDEQGKLVSVTVKKGKVDFDRPVEVEHFVDGLSGATITSNAVTRFVKTDLEGYVPFFETIWGGKGTSRNGNGAHHGNGGGAGSGSGGSGGR